MLLDRLRNDITRLPAVKAFTKIAQSPLQLSLAPHVQALLPELISFLRKANRPLRQASLAAITVRSAARSSCGVSASVLCLRQRPRGFRGRFPDIKCVGVPESVNSCSRSRMLLRFAKNSPDNLPEKLPPIGTD